MRITLEETAADQSPGHVSCAICERKFYLSTATAWAVSDANVLIGEVCLACLEGGAEYIQEKLDKRARVSRAIADEAEEVASEGVSEMPRVDELLVAEAFYGSGE